MVWFYLKSLTLLPQPSFIFQSHFGLILSQLLKVRKFQIYFLSIPFWSDFISVSGIYEMLFDKPFNPILVWFYLNQARKIRIDIHNAFNPILVWFYQTYKRQTKNIFHCFQSHFGLILSCPFPDAHKYMNEISFQSHFGLILSREGEGSNFCERSFQSHFGLILSPTWFFFEGNAYPVFQSHFGLILSRSAGLKS